MIIPDVCQDNEMSVFLKTNILQIMGFVKEKCTHDIHV